MNTDEEKKVGIPESITINGVTYNVKDYPEIQRFIQEVAKVEKSKLYTQFENLKNQISSLGKVNVTGSEESSSLAIDEIVTKLRGTFVTKEDLQTSLKETVKEVVQPVLAATEQNKQEELTRYRESLIQANLATCIPDLIKGDTKEALDASLQESIRIRSAYPTPSEVYGNSTVGKVTDPLIQKQTQELNNSTLETPTQQPIAEVPIAPPMQRRMSPEVTTQRDIKSMSLEQFTKERDRLEAELKAAFGGN